MTVKIELTDLFRVEEIDFMGASEDAGISAIKTQIIKFNDQFVQTLGGWLKKKMP